MHHLRMQLLRFRVSNHRSIRDEVELSLIRPTLRTMHPPAGRWKDYLVTTCAIYGANASGKSTVLEAIQFMVWAIENSTSWPKNERLPHDFFRLDKESADRNSLYSIDFLRKNVRYEYGFSISSKRVEEEWLYYYPEGRQRLLFERKGSDIQFGRGLKGGRANLVTTTDAKELMLTRAIQIRHPMLSPVAKSITEGFVLAGQDEHDRGHRLGEVLSALEAGTLRPQDLLNLLKAADIGIIDIAVEKKEMPDDMKRFLKAFKEVVRGEENDSPDFEELIRDFAFKHSGYAGKSYPLPSSRQSAGTLSWLALAVPAVEVLKSGGIILVDEIDSSLHPRLANLLVSLFRNEETNPSCGQIVFTTHDTYFMSQRSGKRLAAEEIWFAEKTPEGATTLYALSDFPNRPSENYAHRYLDGRYGAVPNLVRSYVKPVLSSHSENE